MSVEDKIIAAATELAASRDDEVRKAVYALEKKVAQPAYDNPVSAGTVDYMTRLLADIFGVSFEWDDSVEDTARRVIKAWMEFMPKKELDFNFTTFAAVANQMIIVKDIEFSSLCMHHLFPYYGIAHVAYLPNELMIGLSKIPRLVQHFARRPSTQERLTRQIASFLKDKLQAQGVAVVIEARHTCMACRGIQAHSASMTTSEMRGTFLTSGEARREFLSLIEHKGV